MLSRVEEVEKTDKPDKIEVDSLRKHIARKQKKVFKTVYTDPISVIVLDITDA